MGRPGVTQIQVFKAATELFNNGINPTIENIRFHLGKTGSNTTLSKYLAMWRLESKDPNEIDIKKKLTGLYVEGYNQAITDMFKALRGLT